MRNEVKPSYFSLMFVDTTLAGCWMYGSQVKTKWYIVGMSVIQPIGHVNEYPTMQYFGIPIHTQSTIAYEILTECFQKFR